MYIGQACLASIFLMESFLWKWQESMSYFYLTLPAASSEYFQKAALNLWQKPSKKCWRRLPIYFPDKLMISFKNIFQGCYLLIREELFYGMLLNVSFGIILNLFLTWSIVCYARNLANISYSDAGMEFCKIAVLHLN